MFVLSAENKGGITLTKGELIKLLEKYPDDIVLIGEMDYGTIEIEKEDFCLRDDGKLIIVSY